MRRALRRGLLALAVLAGVHGALWYAAVSWLRGEYETFVADAAAQGWAVAAEQVHAAGWPFAARLALSGVRVRRTAPGVASGMAWQVASIRVGVGLARPSQAVARFAGPQVLALPGLDPVPLSAARMELDVALRGPPVTRLAVRDLQANMPAAPLRVGTIDVTLLHDGAAGPAGAALRLEAEARGIDAPGLPGPGGRIDEAAVSLRLSGPLPPALDLARLRPPAGAWQAAGGRLDIDHAGLRQGRLALDLAGRFGLDAALQPEGQGTLKAGGIGETLDAMVGAGAIGPGPARAVKAVLALLPQTPEGQVEVPLALADRLLSAARFPLVRVPELRWPDAR